MMIPIRFQLCIAWVLISSTAVCQSTSTDQWLAQRRAAAAKAAYDRQHSHKPTYEESYGYQALYSRLQACEQKKEAAPPTLKQAYGSCVENNAIALGTGFHDWNPQNVDMARQWFTYAMVKEQSLSAMAMIGLTYWRGDNDGAGIDKTRAAQIWLACASEKSNPHYVGEVSSCLTWLRTAGYDVSRQQMEINKALYGAQHPEKAVEGAAILFGLALFYISTGPQNQDCVNAKLAALAGSTLPPGVAMAAANACNGQP